MRLRPCGVSASCHVVNGQAPAGGGLRGKVVGYSSGSARRNAAFLQSVDYSMLPAGGYSVTLTLRDLPSPSDWRELKNALVNWLGHRGASVLLHYVCEFQRRGVPHLHLAVWGVSGKDIVRWWLAHTRRRWRSLPQGQHHRRIRTPAHWARYCAKHGARGLAHYQRNRDTLPAAWREDSAGHMWGKSGAGWRDVVVADDVWVYLGGPADYAAVAKTMHGICGGANRFLFGCSSWGDSYGPYLLGFQFVRAGSTDPPVSGEELWQTCTERYERITGAAHA